MSDKVGNFLLLLKLENGKNLMLELEEENVESQENLKASFDIKIESYEV